MRAAPIRSNLGGYASGRILIEFHGAIRRRPSGLIVVPDCLEIDGCQVGSGQLGSTQIRPAEVGPSKGSPRQVRPHQQCSVKFNILEIGLAKVRATNWGPNIFRSTFAPFAINEHPYYVGDQKGDEGEATGDR